MSHDQNRNQNRDHLGRYASKGYTEDESVVLNEDAGQIADNLRHMHNADDRAEYLRSYGASDAEVESITAVCASHDRAGDYYDGGHSVVNISFDEAEDMAEEERDTGALAYHPYDAIDAHELEKEAQLLESTLDDLERAKPGSTEEISFVRGTIDRVQRPVVAYDDIGGVREAWEEVENLSGLMIEDLVDDMRARPQQATQRR